jgi:type IV fimbrial biogenesis protein FimT
MDVAAARPAPRTRRTGGFTMIELMTSLTIIAIVGSIAIPMLTTMIRNNRLTTVSNDLLGSLMNARTEAVKRQAQVVLCAVPDATATLPVCSLSGATGWVVFQDSNGNWALDANEAVIERRPAIDATITARSNGGVIAFSAAGFPVPTALLTPLRNVVFCDARGIAALGTNSSTARAVVISVTGRAQVVSTVSQVTAALPAATTCP